MATPDAQPPLETTPTHQTQAPMSRPSTSALPASTVIPLPPPPATTASQHPPILPPQSDPAFDPTATLSPVPPTSFSDYSHLLWLSFSVHEHLNIQRGLPEFTTYGAATIQTSSVPESEIQEYHSCRHSFPHVPQHFYPTVRPDSLPGQFLHLTQIPTGTDTDSTTGLSHSHQIVIRFDFGYQEMRKSEVQVAAIIRFETMGIPLSNRFREPVAALIHPHTKHWLGFLKVDLLNPHIVSLALLQGHRILTLQLQDSSYVVDKVEKGFDFPSTTANRKLELKSPILSRYTSRQLLGELTRLGYLAGANLEFVGVSKRTKELKTAEITLASDTSKRYLLDTPILIDNYRIHITVPSSDKNANSNAPEALTTLILVKGLPIEYSQLQITAALHKMLSPKNVISVTYNQADGDLLGRHDGVATIRCLNAAVYIH